MCEKEIREKLSKLCLIEEIKWPKEVKGFSSLRKAEIISSESPSTITEGRWSSRAKEMFDNKDNVINIISKLSRSTDKTINCKKKTNEMLIIIIG